MALRADRIEISLGARQVLRGVDVSIAPGRVTVLLGPNGAGKSTLLRALAGLIVPSVGQAVLDDRNVARLPAKERARMIGYLPQSGDVAWNMRARDVVALGRQPYGGSDGAAIDAALVATDTVALADRLVGTLSGGERARVLLARVLAGEPDWLLADEPLASLDPAHQLDLLDRLRTVAAGGKGVVVVLHDLVQAARVADDAILLKDGRLFAHGPAAETLTPETLGALFDVRMAQAIDPAGRPICIPIERLDR